MSTATDIGLGVPIETGMTICLRAMHLGRAMGISDDDLSRTHSLALIRHIGCTTGSDRLAEIGGDEFAFSEAFKPLDLARPAEVLPALVGLLRREFPGMSFPPALARALAQLPKMTAMAVARCEVAQMLAERLGFGADLQQDLLLFSERWDGKGHTRRAESEDLTPSVRVVQIAEALSLLEGTGDVDAIIQERRGSAYAPDAVDAYLRDPASVRAASDVPSVWDAVLEAEPQPQVRLGGAALDDALSAFADFSDMKSTYLVGHSSGVASLARAAGEHAGLQPSDVEALFRAALVHDVGRAGVSSAIWNHPGSLSADRWEQVRMHAYYSDRVLTRAEALREIGKLASLHHERLDSSGYFRGFGPGQQSTAARILAAADAFHAMLEPRPHRAARTKDQAAEELRAEVKAGRLDPDAADAVLKAAGQPVAKRPRDPAALTAREVDVLRLVARGLAIKQIAKALTVSPKTVDAHIQHIYTKIGVTTRAAATVYAMHNNLVDPLAD